MTKATWIRQNGTKEPISEMQENHLANAYAKSVREGAKSDNAQVRPFLAIEILKRGVEVLVPATLQTSLLTDARQYAY